MHLEKVLTRPNSFFTVNLHHHHGNDGLPQIRPWNWDLWKGHCCQIPSSRHHSLMPSAHTGFCEKTTLIPSTYSDAQLCKRATEANHSFTGFCRKATMMPLTYYDARDSVKRPLRCQEHTRLLNSVKRALWSLIPSMYSDAGFCKKGHSDAKYVLRCWILQKGLSDAKYVLRCWVLQKGHSDTKYELRCWVLQKRPH